MAEKGSHTVLVVDDDPGHRGMLEALLGRWGLAVTSAGDGKVGESAGCCIIFDIFPKSCIWTNCIMERF